MKRVHYAAHSTNWSEYLHLVGERALNTMYLFPSELLQCVTRGEGGYTTLSEFVVNVGDKEGAVITVLGVYCLLVWGTCRVVVSLLLGCQSTRIMHGVKNCCSFWNSWRWGRMNMGTQLVGRIK